MGKQRIKFIEGIMLGGVSQEEPINIGVKDKYQTPYIIQVRPQGNNLLPYRILDENKEVVAMWDTWETVEEVERTFEMYTFDKN